jgi:hypothetical protein
MGNRNGKEKISMESVPNVIQNFDIPFWNLDQALSTTYFLITRAVFNRLREFNFKMF